METLHCFRGSAYFPHPYSAVTRKLWKSLDQSKSSKIKAMKKKMNETLEIENL